MIGNTPRGTHDLSFERAKSYAFNVRFSAAGLPYDLTDCTLRLVARAPRHKGGAVVLEITATLIDAIEGHARFYFQASDLDLDPTDYAYDVTLLTAADYSIPVLKGTLILGDNADLDDTNVYEESTPSSGFVVYMERGSVVHVKLHNVETRPGWTPIFGVASDGDRRVMQVVGWFGGSGVEPDSGMYLGPTGYVDDIEDGTNLAVGSSGGGGGSGIYSGLYEESYS